MINNEIDCLDVWYCFTCRAPWVDPMTLANSGKFDHFRCPKCRKASFEKLSIWTRRYPGRRLLEDRR